MKLLFLDTETTGLDAKENAVIQIAGIVEIDGVVKKEFNFLVRPFKGQRVDQKALDVNLRTMAEIATFRDPLLVYQELVDILDGFVDKFNKADKFYLVGQNTKFDYDFLREFFIRCGNGFLYSYIDYHLIDVITATALFKIARNLPLKDMKLTTVCAHLGIPLVAHDALADVRATREVFHRYIKEVAKCV
jgi:DNA polymerase-3 subunit epsilon